MSSELLQQTNCGFSDRLLRLDVFRVTQNAEFEPALAGIEREAAKDPRKTYDFALWQAGRSGLSAALAWLQRLPGETRTNQPAALLASREDVGL